MAWIYLYNLPSLQEHINEGIVMNKKRERKKRGWKKKKKERKDFAVAKTKDIYKCEMGLFLVFFFWLVGIG